MFVVNNISNELNEILETTPSSPTTIEFIKEIFNDIKVSETTELLKKMDVFTKLLNCINGSKDCTIKELMFKLKVYLYPYLEKCFELIQNINETSEIDIEIIQIIKSLNKYEYYKFNDVIAHFFILYDEYEKINLNDFIQSTLKKEYINLVSDSDTDSDSD